jgi:WD40 repeat protein
VRLWDVATGAVTSVIQVAGRKFVSSVFVFSVAWSPYGRLVMAGTEHGVRIYRASVAQ